MSRKQRIAKKHVLLTESLEPRYVLDSTVVFNEIMYNPAGSDTEWIELHNQMSVDIDMSDWSLQGGAQYSFPAGTVLNSGDFMIVAADPAAMTEPLAGGNILGPFHGRLSNAGERLELRNHIDRLMNVIDFDDSGQWPWAADGSGASLAKLDPQQSSEEPRNWIASEQVGGTPGISNFEGSILPSLEIESEWRFDQSGNDLGTAWREEGFDDSAWATGSGLFYVERSALPAEKSTELTLGSVTYYFRTTFDFSGRTDGTTIQFNHVIDDGAIFYVNGVEAYRYNMPQGEINHTTEAESVPNASFVLSAKINAEFLHEGRNTLAVELHQTSRTSNDVVFGTELFIEQPPEIAGGNIDGLRFDEVAAGRSGAFWLELLNTSVTTLNLKGSTIRSTGGDEYQFGDSQISAGGRVFVHETELGFSPSHDEKLFLYSGDGQSVVDAVIVADVAMGRAAERDDRWQAISQATPREPNQFEFQDDVVINEIMFHHRPTYAQATEFAFENILPLDAEWKFDQSGADLGTQWREVGFDDTNWPVGKGLFFDESSALPGPKSTEIETGHLTYYFRKTFEFAGDPGQFDLVMNHVIDDGAVFYLNGVEFNRFNLEPGAVHFDTEAIRSLRNATLEGLPVPSDLLVQGSNTFAVEVHQSSASSNDVVFGLELVSRSVAKAGTDYVESDLEWIELYNRSEEPIDVGGWQLNEAVSFEFPTNTVLGAKQYLVIPGNADAFKSLFPDAPIAGEYSGILANDNELIELLDANGNIADQVHYYDGGHWPSYSDGNGSSLELLDPFADNSLPEAWAASDESSRSPWKSYSYTKTVIPIVHDPPINFHELVMGLLYGGEVLMDNISVVESPEAEAKQLIQNGDFESDDVNSEADKWRLIGTHNQSRVITDPDNPDNQVLHLIAESRMSYLSNHAETTLADGARVVNGRTYQISFDAKWIAGSPQLHTELYYKDAARTSILEQPTLSGTPGGENSTRVSNLGPTYSDLSHQPVMPTSTDEVEIRVNVSDPNELQTVDLLYADEGEAPFSSVTMKMDETGTYIGIIPPQSNRSVIQFYVQATDGLGATSMYPPAGPDSRALFKVGGVAADASLHDFQVLMIDDDVDTLHDRVNMMDNNRLGSTIIYDGKDVYYDVGTRLRGSMFTRQNRAGTGYNVKFHNDQLFRGVHDSIAFDQNGEREILVKFFAAISGNPGGTYDDILNLTPPSGSGGGPTLAYLARHGDVHLREQFENGEDGALFKFEGIRVMTSTVDGRDPESLKLYQPIGWVSSFDIQDLGDDKELYRWPFLINRNRDVDDFSAIINLAKTFSLTGDELAAAVDESLDMDVWAHTFAIMSLFGIGDAYSQGNPHNLNLYVRPSDGKLLAFPWDWDFVFNRQPTAALHGGKNIGKVFDLPKYERLLMGHMQNLIQTKFNTGYMARWLGHFGGLLRDNMGPLTTQISNRGRHLEGLFPTRVPFLVGAEGLDILETQLANEESGAFAFIPSVENGGDRLGQDWTQIDFQVSDSWKQGKAAVGFEGAPSVFEQLIDLDVSEMQGNNSSVFIRVPFELDEVPADTDVFQLKMKYDDGFVAFLNGVEVASSNAPSDLSWDSRASASNRNSQAIQFQNFDLIEFKDLLQTGSNVLAIQGLNRSATSNDALFVPQLIAGQVQRRETPVITTDNPTALLSGIGWINVKEVRIRGRESALDVQWLADSRWQAEVAVNPGRNELILDAYDFQGKLMASEMAIVESTAVHPQLDSLRVSEVMYHPAPPSQTEQQAGFDNDESFEFVEIVNIRENVVSMAGVSFTDGIDYTFDAIELSPGERIVVAKDPDAFRARYGNEIRVVGPFGGKLSDAGERLVLREGPGLTILDFSYDDEGLWPVRADGAGASLELIDLQTDPAQWSKHYRWQPSVQMGGTPGGEPGEHVGVVINEVLSHTELPVELVDSIELHNTRPESIDIGGWFLSDSANRLKKFEIPIGTTLSANGYIVFDENDFNPTPDQATSNHFALSGSSGDDVWLTVPNEDGEIIRFADDVHFIGANNGEAFMRSTDSGLLLPEMTLTLEAENSEPRIGPVVISEINFHPGAPSQQTLALLPSLDRDDLEFLRITNPTNAPIDLVDWRIRGNVEFAFESQTVLDAGSSLTLIGFDPLSPANVDRLSAFRAHYAIGEDSRLIGGLSGDLSDSEATIQLERAVTTTAGARAYVVEDVVLYDDVEPWPTDTDGLGNSLHRIDLSAAGVVASNWQSAAPSPTADAVGMVGDFDNNGLVDDADIDLLCTATNFQSPEFDLTGDGQVNQLDLRFLVKDVLNSSFGDANLDGMFGTLDLVILFQAGQYEDGILQNSQWATGDQNCDREFTSGDITLMFQDGGFESQLIGNSTIAAAIEPEAEVPHLGDKELDEPETRVVERRIAVDLILAAIE